MCGTRRSGEGNRPAGGCLRRGPAGRPTDGCRPPPPALPGQAVAVIGQSDGWCTHEGAGNLPAGCRLGRGRREPPGRPAEGGPPPGGEAWRGEGTKRTTIGAITRTAVQRRGEGASSVEDRRPAAEAPQAPDKKRRTRGPHDTARDAHVTGLTRVTTDGHVEGTPGSRPARPLFI